MSDWVPVALGSNLDRGCVLGTQVDSDDFVLWREQSGTVHAWPDQCPHRGMRLSLGFVRGDQLGCGYHGWRFGADGRCTFIPAHPGSAVPTALRLSGLECTEAAGMIWIAPAAVAPLSGYPIASTAGVRSMYVRAGAAEVRACLGALSGNEDARPRWCLPGSLAELTVNGSRFTVGVQELDSQLSAVHISCAGGTPIADRLAVAERAAELRSGLEARR